MKTYLGLSKYSLLEIPPSLDSSQELTIAENNALKLCLKVMVISKHSITRQIISIMLWGEMKNLHMHEQSCVQFKVHLSY